MILSDQAREYCLHGAARHAQGDLAGAIVDFDHALELCPRCPEAWNNRGAARHARGDLAGAIADYDRALELNPHYPEAWHNRGAARHARGDLAGAIADYDRALELVPRHTAAVIYHDRGGARHALKDFDGAIADYSQSLAIDPRFCIAYISRGNARYHARDLGGHVDYQVAFMIDPQLAASEIIRLLAADLQSDPVAALANCRKHLRLNPDDLTAYARRGLTLLLQGRDDEAGEDLGQVLRLAPAMRPYLDRLVDTIRQRRRERVGAPGHRPELALPREPSRRLEGAPGVPVEYPGALGNDGGKYTPRMPEGSAVWVADSETGRTGQSPAPSSFPRGPLSRKSDLLNGVYS